MAIHSCRPPTSSFKVMSMKYYSLKLYSLVLLTLFVAACGMKYRSHQEIIQKYVGMSLDDVISDLGAPTSNTTLTTGNTTYLFVSEKTSTEKTSEIRSGDRWQGDDSGLDVYSKVTKTCRTTLVANKKGKIISASSKGDACDGQWVKE